jgi:hypothetical protein
MKTSKTKMQTKEFTSAVIPFEFLNGNIIIRAIIDHDGKKTPVKLILDTGAPTLLSKSFAEANGITLKSVKDMTSTPAAGDAAEEKKQNTASNISFRFGDIEVLKPHLLIYNLNENITKCKNADGFLGSDILSKFGIFIDFNNKTLTLFNKNKIPDSLKNYPIALSFKPRPFGKNPVLSLTVDSMDIHFIWDIGYTGSLMVQYPFSDSSKFSGKLKSIEHTTYDTYGAAADATGIDTTHKYQKLSVVTGLQQKETMLSFPEQNISFIINNKQDEVHANLGTALMKNFNFLIDWDTKKIFLKPNNAYPASKIKIPDYQASFNAGTNQFYIATVKVHSAIYNNGLRAGNLIKTIDGQDIKTLFDKQDVCNIRTTLNQRLETAHSIEVYQGGVGKNYPLK